MGSWVLGVGLIGLEWDLECLSSHLACGPLPLCCLISLCNCFFVGWAFIGFVWPHTWPESLGLRGSEPRCWLLVSFCVWYDLVIQYIEIQIDL